MKILFKGVTSAKGFKAFGVSASIKKKNKLDLALVVSDTRCNAAGVFTKNIVKGHSLLLTKEYIEDGFAQAVLINSGNANACVGPIGLEDAKNICEFTGDLLDIKKEDVLFGSTGVIGYRLPVENIKATIKNSIDTLSYSAGDLAAKAIMTTDTFKKEISVQIVINNKLVTIGGMAKGSGMIHPNMATMIGVITTDAKINSFALKEALNSSVNKSFNKISVDGDTSVCDKVILLANGLAQNREIVLDSKEYNDFLLALTFVSQELSKKIAKDGEGATKLIEIHVNNAKTLNDAELASKAIANSPLVKTAFFGEDANWGRLLTAAGYSGANFDPDKASIKIGHITLFKNGVAIPFNESDALVILKRENIIVEVDFNDGDYDDTVWTCDLSYNYIKINADYRT